MAQAETVVHTLETVEMYSYPGKEPDVVEAVGNYHGGRPQTGAAPSGCRGRAYAQSCSEILIRQTGTGITHEPTPTSSTHFMNRRVWNHKYCGVGGLS